MVKRPVLLVLLGGRLTPALISVLHYQPAAIECVVSEDQVGLVGELRKWLSATDLRSIDVRDRSVDPHDVQATTRACLEAAAAHASGEMILNLTCGTKPMAIGAYEAAKALAAEAVYLDTGSQRLIDLLRSGSSAARVQLSLRDYLAFFGRRPRRMHTRPIALHAAAETAGYLARTGEPARMAIEWLRQNKQKGGWPQQVTCSALGLSEGSRSVLRGLAERRLLADLRESGDTVSYRILSEREWLFLDGEWLEVYVWSEARSALGRDGPAFDECAWGVKIPSDAGDEKEIDVAAMHRGQLVLCSCKTGKQFQTSALDELRAVADLVGGKYCTPVYVTNNTGPGAPFLEAAVARQTVVVSGERLLDVGSILAREAQNPTYGRQ